MSWQTNNLKKKWKLLFITYPDASVHVNDVSLKISMAFNRLMQFGYHVNCVIPLATC